MSRLDQAITASPYPVPIGVYWMLGEDPADGSHEEQASTATFVDEIELTRVVRTDDATSPPGESARRFEPLTAIRLRASMPFAVSGFLSAEPLRLAQADVRVLVLSTFSCDYIFVDSVDLKRAFRAPGDRGFKSDRG